MGLLNEQLRELEGHLPAIEHVSGWGNYLSTVPAVVDVAPVITSQCIFSAIRTSIIVPYMEASMEASAVQSINDSVLH